MAPGPHPLAGQTGEGPPIAPPNWKWRAGNRISDMYFYSPSGKQFRSRPELATYLLTLSDPPDSSLFIWRVTDEVLKNGFTSQVTSAPVKKRKAQIPDGGATKKIKTESVVEALSQPLLTALQTTPMQSSAPSAAMPNLPQTVATHSSPPLPRNRHINGRDKKNVKRVTLSSPRTFKSILAVRSSFKWLYNSDTMEKFLEEATKLEQKSSAEMTEIRKVLLERNIDLPNLLKYPLPVLRVFFRLLRNEEPPLGLGKSDLANLIFNWRCKKRHFWCLLEINRVDCMAKSPKVDSRQEGLAVATKLIGNAGDHNVADCKMGVNHNGLSNPLVGALQVRQQGSKLDLLSASRFGTVADEGLRSAELTSELQHEAENTELTTRRLDGVTCTSHVDGNATSSGDRISEARISAFLERKQHEVSPGPALNFDGESIVVITNYKSSRAGGIGSVFHGDEAVQYNGGSSGSVAPHFPRFSEAAGCGVPMSEVRESIPPAPVSNLQDSDTVSSHVTVSMAEDFISNLQKVGGARSENFVSNLEDGGIIEECPSWKFDLGVPPAPQSVISSPHFDGSRGPADMPETPSIPAKRDDEVGMNGPSSSLKASHERKVLSTPNRFVAGRDSSACWCKICSDDFSFCRGCMCTFCKKSLVPGEDWSVVKCVCNHVCHMDCALAANVAGVVKELGLDGELSCASCSRKVDLWLYLQKRFDMILSLSVTPNFSLKGLEKLLFQPVQLLKGTEKKKYKTLEGLVVEAYELLQRFSFLDLVQQLLRTIRNELQTQSTDSVTETELLELGISSSATPEVMDLLRKEQLAEESLDAARHERLLMEQVVDKVHKAYQDALSKREQARSATISLKPREKLDISKVKTNALTVPELIAQQQAKVDHEMQKLWDMRNFEARNFATFNSLDASAGGWLNGLKSQRVVVDSALAELKQLEILGTQSIVTFGQ